MLILSAKVISTVEKARQLRTCCCRRHELSDGRQEQEWAGSKRIVCPKPPPCHPRREALDKSSNVYQSLAGVRNPLTFITSQGIWCPFAYPAQSRIHTLRAFVRA